MLQSRRALLYQANAFIRSNPLSSISHKKQDSHGATTTPTTPQELTQRYKGSEVDNKATTTRHDVGGEKAGDRNTDVYEEQRETTAGTTKAVAEGAVETGLELGKMAKKTVDGMVDAAENVRDSLGDDGDRRRSKKFDDRSIEEQSSDKFVEDLRRRADGYDLNDRR